MSKRKSAEPGEKEPGVEAKPTRAKPTKAKPTKAKAKARAKAKPTKAKPTKAKPTKTKAKARAKAKPTKTKPTKAKAKPAKAKPTKAKPTKAKPTKAKPTKAKPTKAKPAKAKPAKAKPAKAKPTKAKPKRRKAKAVKPVFQRRPRKLAEIVVVEPEPGATTQDEAYATIKARLEDARKALPEGVDGSVRVHAYVDGSVDGELQIKVPGEFDTDETAWELMDSFGAVTLGQRYWVSVGANYIIEADEEIYRRYRGMNQVQTNYQRAVRANITEEGLVLRKTIVPGMHKRYKREAYSLFIRLHWNPANEHPKR